MKFFKKIPDKLWVVWYLLWAVVAVPLTYVLLGCPALSVRDAFRRAEKANFVGPSEILAVLKMEGTTYDQLVLADAGGGVILYGYAGLESEDTQFLYLEKTGDFAVAVAPGDNILWAANEAALPVFLFDDYPDAVRAELEITLHAVYEGEEFEKTYSLEAQREKAGFFQFSLQARKGGRLGAEGYALYLLRIITGYSMADTADVAFPATVRLYDEAGKLICEKSFSITSAAAKARMA